MCIASSQLDTLILLPGRHPAQSACACFVVISAISSSGRARNSASFAAPSTTCFGLLRRHPLYPLASAVSSRSGGAQQDTPVFPFMEPSPKPRKPQVQPEGAVRVRSLLTQRQEATSANWGGASRGSLHMTYVMRSKSVVGVSVVCKSVSTARRADLARRGQPALAAPGVRERHARRWRPALSGPEDPRPCHWHDDLALHACPAEQEQRAVPETGTGQEDGCERHKPC